MGKYGLYNTQYKRKAGATEDLVLKGYGKLVGSSKKRIKLQKSTVKTVHDEIRLAQAKSKRVIRSVSLISNWTGKRN